jgi:Zn-dependent protease with chaperone function
MDFFENQAQAQRRTKLLVFYFVLAVVAIIAVINGLATLWLGTRFFDPEVTPLAAGGVLLVVLAGAGTKILQLTRGGRVVAESLGGRALDANPTDLRERQLLNVVEEMALASGVPAPHVYLLEGESCINAFAAGNGPGDAVIGVTRGTLERLSRDELQGVIAHEFSHILHGDMRLNLRLMGFLNGILCLAIIGQVVMRYGAWTGAGARTRRDGDTRTLPLVVAGIALYLVGWIGVFFAHLIKAAVSRQREFLADAAAVQFTRNPDGLAGALYKISQTSSRIKNPHAEEASHLFFGNGMGNPLLQAFATHPPIEERIRAISPNFEPGKVSTTTHLDQRVAPQRVAATAPAADAGDKARAWVGRAGMPNVTHLQQASAMLAAMPEEVSASVHSPPEAEAWIYALLASDDAEDAARQIAGLDADAVTRERVGRFRERRAEIARGERLHFVDLCIPALRRLTPDDYARFRRNVTRLIESDARIELFEYVLQKVLFRHLELHFTRRTGPAVRYRSIAPVLPEAGVMLSALAGIGPADEAEKAAAFEDGVRELLGKGEAAPQRTSVRALAAIDAALDKLAEADPEVKRRVLLACGRVVMHNGTLEPEEGDLLRAIADTLDCPIPPFVDAETA